MEIGIQIEPQFGYSYEAVRAIAQAAETAGFTHFWVTDHLFLKPEEPLTNCLEAWSLLAALSQVTSRLRLGTLVTCQSYRPPALLAKVAASLDVMSRGRLELGIGAGWKEVEYTAYGIPFPPAGVRVGQLVDAVEIVRRMWTEERATYRGRHYAVEDALCAPKPVQRPRPPILIGARGPRMMRVVARYADAVNIPDFFLSPAQYREYMDRLRAACEAAGRPYESIRKTHSTYTVTADTPDQVDAIMADLGRRRGGNLEAWRSRLQGATVGTPEQVREQVEAYREAGVSQIIFLFPYEHELEMIRVVGSHVLPHLG